MAKVIESPSVVGDALKFRVRHGSRTYQALVSPDGPGGGIRVEGDLGAHNAVVSAVRAYAAEHPGKIPEQFRLLSVLNPPLG